MKYLIFVRYRIGGGRFIAIFDSGYFYFTDDNNNSRIVHMNNVKRSYLKN